MGDPVDDWARLERRGAMLCRLIGDEAMPAWMRHRALLERERMRDWVRGEHRSWLWLRCWLWLPRWTKALADARRQGLG